MSCPSSHTYRCRRETGVSHSGAAFSAGTQKEGHDFVVSFFLKQTNSFDDFPSGLHPKPNRNPARDHGPSGPRRKCGVNSERSGELRRGGFAVPEHFNRKGGAAPMGGGTQKEGHPFGCPSF